jgi:3-methyladenine DNA glycosylase AlkD
MNAQDLMAELEALGTEQTRKIWTNHGADGPMFGVKVGDMKTLIKKMKKATGKKEDQALASELYATGNVDAMYFAGLIAEPDKISADELERWAKDASWYMVSEYAVAGTAAESPHGWELGLRWIESDTPHVACAGWATLAGWLAIRPDEELDLEKIRALLERIRETLHDSRNRVRYTMNGFVIGVGCYVESLSPLAKEVAEAVGKVQVNVGNTACKVPFAPDYIDKVVQMGRLGQKRKMVRC